MSVKGNVATCSASGKTVSAVVGSTFSHPGSAGIQIWDQAYNTAKADLTNVTIDQM